MNDIGMLPGGTRSIAYDINDLGQIVGEAEGADGLMHPFIHSGGAMSDLGTLPGYEAGDARGISASGQVVGTCWSPDSIDEPTYQAYLYSDEQFTGLGTVPGGTGDSWGNGINDAGQVVGEADMGNGVHHAFVYSEGRMTDLGTLPGAVGGSAARSINSSGQIAGWSITDTGVEHAVIWRPVE